jgi:Fungal specific transcription factor domain
MKCGLQRPKCIQCIKSNRQCLGYDRDVQFIPVRASLTDEKLVVTSSFDEIRRAPSAAQKKASAVSEATINTERGNDLIASEHKEISLSPVSHMLCGSANRQQLLNVFIATCVPHEADGTPHFSKGGNGPWMLSLPQLLMQTPALQTSISAIAASALGRQYGDPNLIKESLKFYTNGLRELQVSLWNPRVMYNDEVLAATLCLGLYEVMECPGDGRQAYYNHCKGCMRLVQGRGVDRHMSGVAHELFLGLRAQGASYDYTHNALYLLTRY